MLLVHQTHDAEVLRSLRLWIVVNPTTMETEQPTLLTHAELFVIEVNPRPSFTNRLRPFFF